MTDDLLEQLDELTKMVLAKSDLTKMPIELRRRLQHIIRGSYKPRPVESKKKITLTPHLSVRLLNNGKVATFVDEDYVSHCRHVFITAPVDAEIDDLDGLIEHYRDNNLHGTMKIDGETSLMVHASNLQAWVENDYNPRVIATNLARVILPKLAKVDDGALSMLLLTLKEEWEDGNWNSREALLQKGDPYFGLIIYLAREGDIPVASVKDHLIYTEYMINKFNNDDIYMFLKLSDFRRDIIISYTMEHYDEFLENTLDKWNNGSMENREKMIRTHVWFMRDVSSLQFGAIVKLVRDGLIPIGQVQYFAPFIKYTVTEHATSDDEVFFNLRFLRERNRFHNRMKYHSNKIYTNPMQRELAKSIRNRDEATINSDPSEYPSYYWAKKDWIEVIDDKRTCLYKSAVDLNNRCGKRPMHVYVIEEGKDRHARCLIRYDDGSFGTEWMRV